MASEGVIKYSPVRRAEMLRRLADLSIIPALSLAMLRGMLEDHGPIDLRVYAAGDYGFTDGGRFFYHLVWLPLLACVFDEVVDPFSLTPAALIKERYAEGRAVEMNLQIGRTNTLALEQCDVIVALLEGQELDSGTVAEIIDMVCRLNRPCYGMRSDLRQAGELGMRFNLQVESYIARGEGQIADSIDGLLGSIICDGRQLRQRVRVSACS